MERDDCGGVDCGSDEICCFDPATGDGACRDMADDEYNCGGCGSVCEWDETCLEDVCALGEGLDCFETTCPEGTSCVSDDPSNLTDPKCKALLVDNEHCGQYENACPGNRRCEDGQCRLKRRMPCGGSCYEGLECCWAQGQQLCVDMQSNPLHCGACQTHCGQGTICDEGTCQPWFEIVDPCPPVQMNCGEGPIVDCKSIVNDPMNCGGCGLPCPGGDVCRAGDCVTPFAREGVPEEVDP